ncbi:MAG: hypothetical protein E7478_02510 [Ruminococcaceae bacterium]|nr:hypothetical protein [Oscillospiraceae bacterium]
MDNRAKTQQDIEQEMLELNEQFTTFLHTKGITAKFKLAFNNMSESLKKQHAQDIAEFEAVKAQSAEDNKEFAEFLRTKGIKAKYKLVIDNIKKGAKAAPANTAAQIAKVQAETKAAVARANALGKPYSTATAVSAASLEEEFNAFLKSKGLDGKYTVSVTED